MYYSFDLWRMSKRIQRIRVCLRQRFDSISLFSSDDARLCETFPSYFAY